LGALPFGDAYFSELKPQPTFVSLFDVMKKSGYRTGFIASSDLHFDGQLNFLKSAGTDVILGKDDYSEILSHGKHAEQFFWGYHDSLLFEKALSVFAAEKQPFVYYLQTISMHTPYQLPDQERYEQKVQMHVKKLNLSSAQQAFALANKYILASVLYTDEQLAIFLNRYAKLPAYQNTIFIITGDHRLPEIPLATKLDRYHVPLIILSPMLKKNVRIQAISSHFDITPSLLAYLNHNYQVVRPTWVTWLGSGLDMNSTFQNQHQIPLKQVKSVLTDFVSGMYFLNGDQLYQIGKHMDIEPVDMISKRKELQNEFFDFKKRNAQIHAGIKLVPDSIYKRFK
jgi:uncharacterized sulfatase